MGQAFAPRRCGAPIEGRPAYLRPMNANARAALLCWTVSCRRPVSRDPIIDGYRAATCIPVSANVKAAGSSHTREWDDGLTLNDGSKVLVEGAQRPGGRITVRYLATAREIEAANAGDYVYPSDVRLDAPNGVLYVKASGLAAGIWSEIFQIRLACSAPIGASPSCKRCVTTGVSRTWQ